MNKIILLLLVVISAYPVAAQNSWQVLPDMGLPIGGPGTRFEDVYFTDSVTGYAVTLKGGVYKTRDAGRKNWSTQLARYSLDTLSKPAQVPFRSIEFLDDKLTGIAGSLSDSVYRTVDGGNTWTNIAYALVDSVPANRRFICGIAHWNNSFYAVGAWGSKIPKFYKSTDKGMTWKCFYPDTSLISSAVDVCFTSQDTGFVTGAYFSNVLNRIMSVVVKTTDGGLSWKRVFSEGNVGGRLWKIQALTPQLLVGSVEPLYADTVAMIRSTDGGDSWTFIGTGFGGKAPNSSHRMTQGIGFVNEKHGWLGGQYNGLFETWDGGQTWDTLNFGVNFNRFFVLDSSHVFAGGQEIYFYGGQLPWPPVTSVHRLSSLPHVLYPVTPNPAGSKVKIEFDLLNSTFVLLQVAGIDSKRSWELESRRLPAGHHTYYWDGSGLPAGNYIVWLGTDEIPMVQKFTLRH